MAEIPESAKLFVSGLIERARKLKKTIAFPEGGDPRVLDAAARLAVWAKNSIILKTRVLSRPV